MFDQKTITALTVCAVAQSCFESNGYTSNVYLQTNNCIGYKHVEGSHWQAGKSPHLSTENDYYARYNCVEDCAGELACWIGRRAKVFKFVDNIESYVKALSVFTYFGSDPAQYLAGCVRWMKTNPYISD